MSAPDPLSAALEDIRANQRAARELPLADLAPLTTSAVPEKVITGYLAATALDGGCLLAAVDAVLELHPQTVYTAHIVPCTAHLSDILGRRGCTNCRRVQRTGCERCRDENGHPARPEDCRERQVILGALLGDEHMRASMPEHGKEESDA